jgi:hypothetical protein
VGYVLRVSSSLVPSSPAGHGITGSQNVARDVEERIDMLRAATRRSRIGAYAWFLGPLAVTVGFAVTEAWPVAFITAYFGALAMPIGFGVHVYRRRAMKAADVLDRERDVAWVSQKDGLIFFADEGLFIEKRGGFKPYGVSTRRYTHAELVASTLVVHGVDRTSGATYAVDVAVPHGWTDDDTRRVREKLTNFTL